MKNVISLIVLLCLLISCSKNENTDQQTGKVLIKGKISAAGAKKIYRTKGAGYISLADAKKVMIFRGSDYTISNISDSSFSVSADAGTTNALAFLDKDNKFIGVLCTEGLNVMPLVGLKDGDNTIIDLQKLTMPGDSVIPMHNPFGDEIDLSPDEIESLRAVGSYYEALAKNIDADNNGELDILVKKHVVITFHFNLIVGKLGVDLVPPDKANQQNLYINYGVELRGGPAFGPVSNSSTLTGPEGKPSNNITLWGFANTANEREAFLISFIRQGTPIPGAPTTNNFMPYDKGIYTFTPYTGTNLRLHFSNVDARDNLIIVSPTLKTDGKGKIVSVEFTYTLPGGKEVNPENLISDFMLQYRKPNGETESIRPLKDQYYKYTFSAPIDLATFAGMDLFYYDLLGNYYNNNWRK